MLKKIDLFLHSMLFDTCRSFTTHFAKALMRRGIECRLFDFEDGKVRESIQTIFNSPPDLTFAFTAKGSFNNAPIGQTFFCQAAIPHFAYMLDTTFYFENLASTPHLFMGAIDEYDCIFQNRIKGMNSIFFLPHAVEREVEYSQSEERPYDVSLIGAIFDYEYMRTCWPLKYSKEIIQVMEATIERVLADPSLYFVFAFLEESSLRKICWDKINPLEVLQQIEGYFRSYERVQLVRSITDADVHVFGPCIYGKGGWSKYVGSQSNVTVHAEVLYEESLQLIKKTKILINSTPSYRKGAHERIFNGLGLGALVFAGENLYLPQHFKEGEEMIYFRAERFEEINDKINFYLDSEQKRKEVVEQGREKVLRYHTWDHRAAVFLEKMESLLAETSFRKA